MIFYKAILSTTENKQACINKNTAEINSSLYAIISESGSRPPYFIKLLSSNKLNQTNGMLKLQNDYICYNVKEDLMYLVIGYEKCADVMSNFEDDTAKHRDLHKDQKNNKDRNALHKDGRRLRPKDSETRKDMEIRSKIADFINFCLLILKQLFENLRSLFLTEKSLFSNLVSLNFSPKLSSKIIESLPANFSLKRDKGILKDRLKKLLNIKSVLVCKNQLHVITLIGTNGVGKSSFISKLVYLLTAKGHNITVIAADTFRSGAIEQLRVYMNRLLTADSNIRLIEGEYNNDECKIVRKAMKLIIEENKKGIFDDKFNKNLSVSNYKNDINSNKNFTDILIIDTSGRIPTNKPLYLQLKKLTNITNSYDINTNNLNFSIKNNTILVSELLSSQIQNIEMFKNQFDLKSVILTKLDCVGNKIGMMWDVSAMGLNIVGVCKGQGNCDLELFDGDHDHVDRCKSEFVDFLGVDL